MWAIPERSLETKALIRTVISAAIFSNFAQYLVSGFEYFEYGLFFNLFGFLGLSAGNLPIDIISFFIIYFLLKPWCWHLRKKMKGDAQSIQIKAYTNSVLSALLMYIILVIYINFKVGFEQVIPVIIKGFVFYALVISLFESWLKHLQKKVNDGH